MMRRGWAVALCVVSGCGTAPPAAKAPPAQVSPSPEAAVRGRPLEPQLQLQRSRAMHHSFRELPPPGGPGAVDLPVTSARVFAFGDTQFHHMFGKRTWAQSPFADRQSIEVAVRPAAVDDAADLLLEAFVSVQQARYPSHTRVYMGDAADVSCTQEFERFFGTLGRLGITQLIALTSNHDGFFVGNYTRNGDLDGSLGYAADMPDDWTRACAEPGSRDDHRLTRGRALARLVAALPAAPAWATNVSLVDADGPKDYRRAWLTAVRPLSGGDPGAAPAWAALIDTSDYRDYDVSESRGAGTVGSVSRAQLVDLDHAMFEARAAGSVRPWWLAFGHHPFRSLDSRSKKRVLAFLDVHPEIVGWVTAHTHLSGEDDIKLPGGRIIPELVVGSTLDAPEEARLIELRVAADGTHAGVASWRLGLDVDDLCRGIPALDPDSLGYLGYRLVRDDTPDVSIGWLRKIGLYVGLSDLDQERAAQTMGALLVENDLVRALAHEYLLSPLVLTVAERAALEVIAGRRFPQADTMRDLRQVMALPLVTPFAPYELWTDPVLAAVVPPMTRAINTFAATRPLFEGLRARRRESAETQRWFACHGARAAAAEAARPRAKGNIVYIP